MKPTRRSWLGLVLVAVVPLGGCLSADVVHWARHRSAPGHPLGVARVAEGDDVIAYSLDDAEGNQRVVLLHVPAGWVDEPRQTLRSGAEAGIVRLAELPPWEPADRAPDSLQRLLLLDHRLTHGHAVPGLDLGRDVLVARQRATSYGIVRYRLDEGERAHEVQGIYAYDPVAYRWVEVGTIDLGELEPGAAARVAAPLLFVPALAVDVAGVLFVVFLMACSNGSGGDFPAPFGGVIHWPPLPVPIETRGAAPLEELAAPGASIQ